MVKLASHVPQEQIAQLMMKIIPFVYQINILEMSQQEDFSKIKDALPVTKDHAAIKTAEDRQE